jgi:3-isopropylmalate/(R)-2-methylmalate dehydratase small subunit
MSRAGESITRVAGRGVPVRGNDIDTDRIIPARFLKCVTFDGLGAHAFADDIADLASRGGVHPLADPRFSGAAILVGNANFGCGSSREHAPQALMRWGIRALVVESCGEIFFGNCVSMGIPVFSVDPERCEEILSQVEREPGLELVLDVSSLTLQMAERTIPVFLPEGARGQFLDGTWNARATLLAHLNEIDRVAAALPYLNGFFR